MVAPVGLYCSDPSKEQVVLKNVSIQVDSVDFCAEVHVVQTYENASDETLEVCS